MTRGVAARAGARGSVTPERGLRGGERGSVTVELAVGLVGVVLVLALVLTVVSAGVAQLRCVDGARAGARAALAGEPSVTVTEVARRVAGRSAQVTMTTTGGWVQVSVSRPVAAGVSEAWTASATATVPVEP
jgi:hypothetical protein